VLQGFLGRIVVRLGNQLAGQPCEVITPGTVIEIPRVEDRIATPKAPLAVLADAGNLG
jgi:hypothetical protein